MSSGELRFAILGGPEIVAPDTAQQGELARWIRDQGRKVDPALWREAPEPARPPEDRQRRPATPLQLYDLRPDTAAPPQR